MTYWLRALGGLGAAALLVLASGANPGISSAQWGARLFASLNLAAYYFILLGVPLLTADCLSREKREGTLGLLFLTPLRPWEIVVGKAITQGLRGATLLGALTPLLLLPSLWGGVSWLEVALAALIQTSAFLIALTSGIIVSSVARQPVRSALAASLLSLTAAVPLNLLLGEYLGARLWPPLFLPESWISGVRLATASGASAMFWAILPVGVALATAAGLRQAAHQLGRFWQESENALASARATAWVWARLIALGCLTTQGLILFGNLAPAIARTNRDALLWLTLLWLAPLLILTPLVRIHQLVAATDAERATGPLRAATAGWRWFMAWFVFAAALPLVAARAQPGWTADWLLAASAHAAAVLGVGLAAAHLAYAWRPQWSTALAWSFLFTLGLELVSLAALGSLTLTRSSRLLAATTATLHDDFSHPATWPLLGLLQQVAGSPAFVLEAPLFWQVQPEWQAPLLRVATTNALGLAAASLAAAWATRRLGHARTRRRPTRAPLNELRELVQDFCEPLIARGWFRRRHRQWLDVNPARWLWQRAWTTRLTRWGWCLAVLVAQIPLFGGLPRLQMVYTYQTGLLVALLAAVAYAAANSLQRERDNGVLELLLVTPLPVHHILRARRAVLVRQFLPAYAAVLLLTMACLGMTPTPWRTWDGLLAVVTAVLPVLSLPWIGLYWSLRLRGPVSAWLATCASTLAVALAGIVPAALLAAALPYAAASVTRDPWLSSATVLAVLITQAIAARYASRAVTHGLTTRRWIAP